MDIIEQYGGANQKTKLKLKIILSLNMISLKNLLLN